MIVLSGISAPARNVWRVAMNHFRIWLLRFDTIMEWTEYSFAEPQHEAAFFYGLFLRGHPVQKLREDIDVPQHVLAHWQRLAGSDPVYQGTVARVLAYRKHVLAIFDSLIFKEIGHPNRLQ